MDHAALVGVVSRLADLCRQGDHLADAQVSLGGVQALQAGLQGLPHDELHHHVIQVAIVAEIEHLHDIGMSQVRHRGGFFFEAAEEFRVVGEVGMDQLDGYRPAQVGVISLVHRGHASLADQRLDLIPAS